jgi:hypothetical protein
VVDDAMGDEVPADGESDPFEGLTLDEDFIRGADIVEESADARLARLARIDAEHRRLAAEREVQQQALEKSLRRRERKQRRTARGGDHRRRLVVIGVMLAVFAGLVYWNVHNQGSQVGLGTGGLLGRDVTGGTVSSSARPPAGVGEASQPLGSPAPVALESSSYRFMETQPGSSQPVAYDPCRAIHVVMNERTVVPGGGTLVQQGLDEVSRATGLVFVVEGLTDEAPTTNRQSYQPDRYPGRWAPVLIAWTDPAETPGLAGDVAGLGGSSWASDGKASVYVSGDITLDGPDLARVQAGPEGAAGVRSVIEHELGHLVGLDHVDDPTQLMNPTGGSVTAFGAGDLTGLARLGQGECFPKV